MPAIQPYIIEPIWEQFAALLPRAKDRSSTWLSPASHPRQGGLREARAGFGVRLRLLEDRRRGVLGHHAAPPTRRVDREGDDGRLAGDGARSLRPAHRPGAGRLGGGWGCITKAPCGGEKAGKSPVDRGKRGIKRSTVVDACGIPLGAITAPANHHDSPLLDETLDTLEALGPLPDRQSVHLDRGYDSAATREKLRARGLTPEISHKGKPAPMATTKRWVIERTNSWHNAHKKLAWCTERVGRVIDFWVTFSEVVIIVRRLIREAWTHYRWEGRPSRRP